MLPVAHQRGPARSSSPSVWRHRRQPVIERDAGRQQPLRLVTDQTLRAALIVRTGHFCRNRQWRVIRALTRSTPTAMPSRIWRRSGKLFRVISGSPGPHRIISIVIPVTARKSNSIAGLLTAPTMARWNTKSRPTYSAVPPEWSNHVNAGSIASRSAIPARAAASDVPRVVA